MALTAAKVKRGIHNKSSYNLQKDANNASAQTVPAPKANAALRSNAAVRRNHAVDRANHATDSGHDDDGMENPHSIGN